MLSSRVLDPRSARRRAAFRHQIAVALPGQPIAFSRGRAAVGGPRVPFSTSRRPRPNGRALGVRTDRFLNLSPAPQEMARRRVGLLTPLRRIERLPATYQRAVLKLVNALLEKHRVR